MVEQALREAKLTETLLQLQQALQQSGALLPQDVERALRAQYRADVGGKLWTLSCLGNGGLFVGTSRLKTTLKSLNLFER